MKSQCYSTCPYSNDDAKDDLFCSDIEGQIERCYVRFDEGIMPDIFEARLESYLKLQQRRE